METIVEVIDKFDESHNEDIIEQVANEVNEMMSERAISFSKNLFKVFSV
jgi:glycine hydroxymethyltransferase